MFVLCRWLAGAMDEDIFGTFVCNLDDLDDLDGPAAPVRKKAPEQAETKTGVYGV
jgi:hypothetical protein